MEEMLALLTGYSGISLQPMPGPKENIGLLAIDAYHQNNEPHRNICLILTAHGTNPASHSNGRFKVVPVDCDEEGNIDINDLKKNINAL